MTTTMMDLMNVSQQQKENEVYSPVHDTNINMFKTPINEKIIVYIPKRGGEALKLVLHDYKSGKIFGRERCIKNVVVDAEAQIDKGNGDIETYQVKYDGECPLCRARRVEGELANVNIELALLEQGFTLENVPEEVKKQTQREFYSKMALQKSTQYVIFPIVIIPVDNKYKRIEDKEIRTEYVLWKAKRYEENILKALESMIDEPESPEGLFWLWDFTYNTEGKEPTAMLSAKNAKYKVIENDKVLSVLREYEAEAEESAKEYTNLKAITTIKDAVFKDKEVLEKLAKTIEEKAATTLEVAKKLLENYKKRGVETVKKETPVEQGFAALEEADGFF